MNPGISMPASMTGIRHFFHALIASCTLLLATAVHARPFVLAYTDGQVEASYGNLQAFYRNLSAVGLGSTYGLTVTGKLHQDGMNETTENIIRFAKSKSLPLYPTVSDYNEGIGDFDPAISHSIVNDKSLSADSIKQLVTLAKEGGFAGINLDFEKVEPRNAKAFSAYVKALGNALHASNKKLIISIPPKSSDREPEYLQGYDYKALGAAVDYFQVMTYDQVGPGWSSGGFHNEVWPGPESGADWQRALLSYAVSRVPASKVLAGLPAYGQDYSIGNRVHWSAYQEVIAEHRAVTHLDAVSATPYATWGPVKNFADGVEWTQERAQPVLWYDDAASIKTKTALVAKLGLGGTSVWAVGYENAEFWTALQSGLKAGSELLPAGHE
ncbi:glycosyl hydrolase family 18 protein [Pseudomonas sp. Fl4BN1]|uniref:glycosyl hydrolase family 18 protein n=1 Tax=Pseudomonas sp. Fl4BN1 TaxID=2697651 RepID=UPI001376FC27|nr:glycosyl hydrolase family 18 protein [Pseudomonas sp. Fl4BN1]NBF10351.1 glycosyl hydrolase [Pseudomonas sp. Fl4BN1]